MNKIVASKEECMEMMRNFNIGNLKSELSNALSRLYNKINLIYEPKIEISNTMRLSSIPDDIFNISEEEYLTIKPRTIVRHKDKLLMLERRLHTHQSEKYHIAVFDLSKCGIHKQTLETELDNNKIIKSLSIVPFEFYIDESDRTNNTNQHILLKLYNSLQKPSSS